VGLAFELGGGLVIGRALLVLVDGVALRAAAFLRQFEGGVGIDAGRGRQRERESGSGSGQHEIDFHLSAPVEKRFVIRRAARPAAQRWPWRRTRPACPARRKAAGWRTAGR